MVVPQNVSGRFGEEEGEEEEEEEEEEGEEEEQQQPLLPVIGIQIPNSSQH